MSACIYSRAWIGRCGAETVGGDYCAAHAQIACSCGEKASLECSYTGQFVCGAPLCDRCEGFEDRSQPSGSWGFLNHWHRRKIACEAVPPSP